MAAPERVQQALAAASGLSNEEREELIAELIVGLERDRHPEPGYDEAWSKEIRRRVLTVSQIRLVLPTGIRSFSAHGSDSF
ncbi:MAG: addiction module protein [Polyangiaceae bacterium]|jgi:putative addiction module component